MDDLFKLRDAEDRNRLVRIIESSFEVQCASQFFAWTQGPLHALLPHEILICCLANAPGRALQTRYFTATRYFRQEHFETACHPRSGLISRVITHWRGSRQPCLIPSPPLAPPCDPAWEVLLQRLELRNMAGHGQMAHGGKLLSWFGFFRVGNLDHRLCLLLELLLPVITETYARAVRHEQSDGAQALKLGNPLTGREFEVLQLLRAGLTNAEIAEQLKLSVSTAKNHVQNIRVKLKVRTRGLAVAEAIRLGLIDNEDADAAEARGAASTRSLRNDQ